MATCAKEGCNNELKTGKLYCSTTCAAYERERKHRARVLELPEGIPPSLIASMGIEGKEALAEMRRLLLEEAEIKAPTVGRTQGDWQVTYWVGGGERRPSDALSFDIIAEMMKSGPVLFVLEMKLAALMSVWRNERSWRVYCPDSELQEIVQSNLRKILPRAALDFVRSALIYGTSFSELVWEQKTRYELGMSQSRGARVPFYVSKLPQSVNPETVERINRKVGGEFDGFVQTPKYGLKTNITVPADQALVIPYRGMFRSLWGESFLKPIYPLWFWFEVALRSWVRFMERQGTPVAVAYAPSRAKVRKPGTDTLVDAMTWGLAVAGNIAKSNAAVMPSDVHPDTKAPLWRLEYLKSEDRGQVFSTAIEMLMQLMVRASLSADRATTQSSGGVGSYNIGEIHDAATQMHNELIMTEMVSYINQYWMPRFSLYNRGVNGPPIWLETEGLDPREKERLFKLFNIAGNAEGFNEALMMIDWRRLFEVNNVPTLDEEEVAALKKELEKEALRKQKQFIKQKSPRDEDSNEAPFGKQKPEEDKPEEDKPEDENDEKMKKLSEQIVTGKYVPIVLSEDQMKRILQTRKEPDGRD